MGLIRDRSLRKIKDDGMGGLDTVTQSECRIY
jgi:hypothetical protein